MCVFAGVWLGVHACGVLCCGVACCIDVYACAKASMLSSTNSITALSVLPSPAERNTVICKGEKRKEDELLIQRMARADTD